MNTTARQRLSGTLFVGSGCLLIASVWRNGEWALAVVGVVFIVMGLARLKQAGTEDNAEGENDGGHD